MKLKRGFYTRETLTVAQEFLGKYLVRKIGKKTLVGKIVETEAYIGPKDKASHAFGGKLTPRNQAEYLKGGYIYIYLCYGMYWQLNITTSIAGKPECVLIRALEPIFPHIASPRVASARAASPSRPPRGRPRQARLPGGQRERIASGPGKLCRWLKLDKSFYGQDLTTSKRIWLETGNKVKPSQIVKAKRIGIDYAQEWKDKPWRFYLKDNPFVSKR